MTGTKIDLTSTEDREVRSSRVFHHSVGDLFEAFADPAKLTNWWGPNGFTSDIQTFEFRPGGRWLMTLIGPDGTKYPNEATFLEIVPNQRVVFSHDCAPLFIMTMTFESKGADTLLRWWMVFESSEIRDKVAGYCIPGNEQNYDRLATYLQSDC